MNPRSCGRSYARCFFSNAALKHLQRLREPNRMRRPSGGRYVEADGIDASGSRVAESDIKRRGDRAMGHLA